MLHDVGRPRAERSPHGELLRATRATEQQQIADVDAGEQQQHRNGGCEHAERRFHIPQNHALERFRSGANLVRETRLHVVRVPFHECQIVRPCRSERRAGRQPGDHVHPTGVDVGCPQLGTARVVESRRSDTDDRRIPFQLGQVQASADDRGVTAK